MLYNLPDAIIIFIVTDFLDIKSYCKTFSCDKKNQSLYKIKPFIIKPYCFLSNKCIAWLQKWHKIDFNDVVNEKYFIKVDNGIHVVKVLPSATSFDGAKIWYQNEKLHCNDGPARIYPDGKQYWYKNEKLHRDDGPAVFYSDGTQYWHKDGKLHRENGPAEIFNGDQAWWKNGKRHHDDIPAVIWSNGTQEWYKNGELHKNDD